jgi:hypothetical protein
MLLTAVLSYFAIPSCGTMGRLGLKWLSLAYQERPVHNRYQLGLYFIPVKPGKICILYMVIIFYISAPLIKDSNRNEK